MQISVVWIDMSVRIAYVKLIKMFILHPIQPCYCCPLEVWSLTWALTRQFHVPHYVSLSGGNSGIGKDTAVALAMRGARVIIACRDVDKAEKAVREIKFKSHSLNVLHMGLDLANLRSVREFCKSFLQREKRLDILINNAGEGVDLVEVSWCTKNIVTKERKVFLFNIKDLS